MRQDQFLDVIDRDEAERRFRRALDLRPLGSEVVPLTQLLGRVLAADVLAPVDVPAFDRSNVDGFAVRAQDTFGCTEEEPVRLRLLGEALPPGRVSTHSLLPGTALPLATGAVVPRGADAVVMVEFTDLHSPQEVIIRRPVTPGSNITCAGTDIGRGEMVLWRGERLTARETGVLAALGLDHVAVVRRPRVAILSTGDELVAPGQPLAVGQVYDSNAGILADAVRELGGEPIHLGIVADDEALLLDRLRAGLQHDIVLLSGGTSKGAGDVSYRVVGTLGPPGIVAHGVALKPGKPLCLAVVRTADTRLVPVVILPGFPTSAIFTFREFVAPVIRELAGQPEALDPLVPARLALRVNSERGRTEYLLVGLVHGEHGLAAYPMGKGSGSVTTFSRADGFVVIPRQQELVEADEAVTVHLLGETVRPADLVVIGSHCVGLDYLLGLLQQQSYHCKLLAVGSSGGLAAAKRGECDVAGVHLLDPASGTYNTPFLTPALRLLPGYGRAQGIIHRADDARFKAANIETALADPECVMVNRNRGSGTRILLDRLLQGRQPSGYWTEARSHNAVVAAVAQGRADWGVALIPVATAVGLHAIPLQQEQYDLVIPVQRWERPAVVALRELLHQPQVRAELQRRVGG